MKRILLRHLPIAKTAGFAHMEALGGAIQTESAEAISSFRKTHIIALMINISQLVVIVWSLIAARL